MKPPAPSEMMWSRLTAAARAAREAQPVEEETAPYGFATQVIARWQEMRAAEQRLALWQRVSWRVAFASLAAYGVLALSPVGKSASRGLLEPPPLPWPSPGSLAP